MKKFLILSLLFLPFIFTSCGPDGFLNPEPNQVDTLPPITTEGLQTFGYKVNGEVVTYDNQSARYINLDHQPENGKLAIQLSNIQYSAGFGHDSILNTSFFKLDPFKIKDLNYVHGASFTNKRDDLKYWKLIEGGGEILRYYIDNDKPEYIISGTFWYTVVDEDNPSDTAFITEGRFDLNKR